MKATSKNYWDILKQGDKKNMTKKYSNLNTFIIKSKIPELFRFPEVANTAFHKFLLFSIFIATSFSGFAQETKISSAIDSTRIKIGEQIIYSIQVETDSTNLVVFPEGQTFNPMEVVESLQTDTSRVQNRFRLFKEYALTQFDSGNYTIPRQRVLVNDTPYFTDSMRVEVSNVVVDTTKQKMYPIKPAMEVPSGFQIPNWVWWFLGILLLIGLGYYFFRRRKKKQEAAKQLPPYERALFELQQLDQSQFLENRQTKEYYSKLTEAVRRYLEDEIHLRAMESTTSELIHDLEIKMEAGQLKLSRETIDELKRILQRADLAKFANSRPDVITAKGDRSKIEHVINDTKAAIPEPTEEELLKDEAYRIERLRKRKRKKIIYGVLAGVLVIAIVVTALITTKGYDYLQDILIGNETKELLEGEWIQSEYGDPLVSITTPRVLTRGIIERPDEANEMLVGDETFIDGSLENDLYVVVSTLKFQKEAKFDLNTAVEGVYANLEKKGAKNIIVKDEKYNTIQGVEGVKVFGTLELENPATKRAVKKEYIILNFGVNQGFQQITVIFDEQDPFAEEIANRIINSVEFENPTN
ncbi:LPXTG cell wall anchor domain-containing protein [Gillisia sp. Q332]|uniref:LPXTG cell wall anchor domain-containing protein n=1 Tax=Gillisia xinjiangensis TaxID=3384765 RepID=UPI00391A68F5